MNGESRIRVNARGETELRCGHCKEWLPATEEYFYRNVSRLIGWSGQCRTCHKAAVKKHEHTPAGREQKRRSRQAWEQKQQEQQRPALEQARIERQIARTEREQQRQIKMEQRRTSTLVYENKVLAQSGQCRCICCKKIYSLDWAHFGTKRLKEVLSAICFVCRNPTEYGGREGAIQQLLIRSTPVLWEAEQKRKADRARAQDRAKEKKYMKSPKGKRRLQVVTQNKRARKKALPHTLTTPQWNACLDYFDHRCAICGASAGFFVMLAQEHWIPQSPGYELDEPNPGTVVTNIIPMCHSTAEGMYGCNNMKSNRDPQEWLLDTYGKRKTKQIEARIQAYFDFMSVKAKAS